MIKQLVLATVAVAAFSVSAAATAQDRPDAVNDNNAVRQGEARVQDDRRDLHGDLTTRGTDRSDVNHDKGQLRADTTAERNDVHDARNDAHVAHQAALDRAHHQRLVHHQHVVHHRTHVES